MKAILFLMATLLGVVVLAEAAAQKCECPLVKCAAADPGKLCQCINARETKCREVCPTYTPTIKPCAIPPPTVTPSETCVCEAMACAQLWPSSCYCANGNLKRCWEDCGRKGPEPQYQVCAPPTSGEAAAAATFETSTKASATRTATVSTRTRRQRPSYIPTATNPVCGGGRANYHQCDEGYTCIKDPAQPGCGPECDGLGVCVKDQLCGGFAGFRCEAEGQVCVDDPRDDCDPQHGGADCGGLCMWRS